MAFTCINLRAQEIAILKYQGGGDWYANPTALPNLIKFCNDNIGTTIQNKPETVEVGSSTIFQYPYLHMTGHGNVVFSDEEIDAIVTAILSFTEDKISSDVIADRFTSKEALEGHKIIKDLSKICNDSL